MNDAFARTLKRLMAERGMNQSDLARAIWGTTTDAKGYVVAKNRDRISNWLKGRQVPSAANRAALAAALEVDEAELGFEHRDDFGPEGGFSIVGIGGPTDPVRFRANLVLPAHVAVRIGVLLTDPASCVAA